MFNVKRKATALIIVILMLCATLNGCNGGSNNQSVPSQSQPSASSQSQIEVAPASESESTPKEDTPTIFDGAFIVSAEYAIGKIGDDSAILIDARGTDAAKKGTLEGAMALTWQELSNVNGKAGDEMWGTVLPAEQLAEALGGYGLDSSKEIILFADANKGWGSDGRILWTLRMAGYQNLKMVDGGIFALERAGANLVKDVRTYDPVEVSVASLDMTHCINTSELKDNYDQYKVVDARDPVEYEGATNYGEAKGGHLPGAVNINYTDLFMEDGALKSNDEIAAMLEAQGISTNDQVITYCTAGIRSAYMQLVFEMCGYDKVKNYDESYYRWCVVSEVE